MSKFGDFLHDLWHVTHPGQACDKGSLTVITDVGLTRQMYYDAFDQPEEVAQRMGLPAVSDEVVEMELRANHERMERLVPIMPLLVGQAEIMGHAAAALHLEQLDVEVPDEAVEATHLVFTAIVKASIIAAVSSAVSMGVLEITKGVTVDE